MQGKIDDLVLNPESTIKRAEQPLVQPVGNSLLHSIVWNAAGDWISQIFSWAAFLIVVRLLSPADFGIVAMAATLGPLVQYFAGCGIPRAIVTMRDLSDEQLAQLNTLCCMLGLASFGVACLLAKPLAMFYGTPRVAPVFIVSCIGLLFAGAQAVSNGLLLRAKRFRELSIFAAMSAMLSAALTLLFAWLRWGYWALVLGALPSVIFRAGLVMRTRRQSYAWPRWNSVKHPLRFGIYVVFSMIALNFYQNLDNLTAGRMLGQTALGLYAMAWTLAYVPLDKVTSMVTTVLPAYVAAVQTDLNEVRRYVRVLTENLALLMFPACVGFGLVAHESIPFVLGSKWEGVAAPLEVLSIYAAFRSIAALLPKVLIALGYPRFVMWNDIAAILVLGLAFVAGSHLGITGIAWGWVVGYPLVIIPLYRKAFTTIGMKLGEYMAGLRPAIEGTIFMAIAVEFVKRSLPNTLPLVARLGLEIASGAVFYSATMLLRHHERIVAFWKMAKGFRKA